jgi:hypothetical protein
MSEEKYDLRANLIRDPEGNLVGMMISAGKGNLSVVGLQDEKYADLKKSIEHVLSN